MIYKKLSNVLTIETEIPKGDGISITIEGGDNKTPITMQIPYKGEGVKSYQTPKLAYGNYTLTVKTPPFIVPINPVPFEMKPGTNPILKIPLIGAHVVHVTTNNPSAEFVLKNEETNKVWVGRGSSYQFQQLLPGNYSLNYVAKEDDKFIPPEPKRFSLSRYRTQNENYQGIYEPAGKVTLSSNALNYKVRFEALTGSFKTREERIDSHKKTIYLPEGTWRATFFPLEGQSPKNTPPIQEIIVTPYSSQELQGEYAVDGKEVEIEKEKEPIQLKEMEAIYV